MINLSRKTIDEHWRKVGRDAKRLHTPLSSVLTGNARANAMIRKGYGKEVELTEAEAHVVRLGPNWFVDGPQFTWPIPFKTKADALARFQKLKAFRAEYPDGLIKNLRAGGLTMTAAYDAYLHEIGRPLPQTHAVYQLRRDAALIATCAALTPDDAAGHFHDDAPAGLGIDPVGTSIVRVSSRHPATVVGE